MDIPQHHNYPPDLPHQSPPINPEIPPLPLNLPSLTPRSTNMPERFSHIFPTADAGASRLPAMQAGAEHRGSPDAADSSTSTPDRSAPAGELLPAVHVAERAGEPTENKTSGAQATESHQPNEPEGEEPQGDGEAEEASARPAQGDGETDDPLEFVTGDGTKTVDLDKLAALLAAAAEVDRSLLIRSGAYTSRAPADPTESTDPATQAIAKFLKLPGQPDGPEEVTGGDSGETKAVEPLGVLALGDGAENQASGAPKEVTETQLMADELGWADEMATRVADEVDILNQYAALPPMIADLATDPPQTTDEIRDRISEISEQATAWHDNHKLDNLTFWSRHSDRLQRELYHASEAFRPLVGQVLGSALPDTAKAVLIDAAVTAHSAAPSLYNAVELWKDEIATELLKGNTGICAHLFHMPESRLLALEAVDRALYESIQKARHSNLSHISETTLPSLAGALILPLANSLDQPHLPVGRMERQVDTMSNMLNLLEQRAAAHPDDTQLLQDVRAHFSEAANAVATAFINHARANHARYSSPRGLPIGRTTAVASVRLLDRLHFSTIHDRIQLPITLVPFMTALFRGLENYGHYNDVRDIAPAFNRLAEACGLDKNSRLTGRQDD